MKLSEILTKKTYEQYGDMDVANDCIDELAPAWCGNLLTDEGKRHFARVLDLDAEIRPVWGYMGIVVLVDHLPNYAEMWEETLDLFNAMCGYCDEEQYDRWFTDDEEEAPPKSDKEVFIKTYVEPMLIAANVGIKAVDYYLHEAPYIDENYRTHYHEEVVLTYESGFTRLINVECDSKAAMVEDIYKQGGVY